MSENEPTGGVAPGFEELAEALYRGLLDREPDLYGLSNLTESLRGGYPLENAIRDFIASGEFEKVHSPFKPVELPDLTRTMPQYYDRGATHGSDYPWVFRASGDDDIDMMERLISECGYYDSFGVWNPRIDLDKQITATIVRGLGARSCLELGCFSGPVLSLLQQQGLGSGPFTRLGAV